MNRFDVTAPYDTTKMTTTLTGYDAQGNMTYRVGWGGTFGTYTNEVRSFANNRQSNLTYDAAGNLTNDGAQYTYDVTGQQVNAAQYPAGWGGYTLQQSYDGDGLRAKKTDNGVTTYALRSSVLGGQVVAELQVINGVWTWVRGYVYLGGQLLAIQANGVRWVHQDPITKSQRVTDANGAVTTTQIDLDPWGGETSRSADASTQPQRYTTYTRDTNGGDEAMLRRYSGAQQRFAQPDTYDGSYSLTDPQSLNRYSYVQNDPVNFVDPSGLLMSSGCSAEFSYGQCGGDGGFWGGGGGGFGDHVAIFNRDFAGVPAHAREAYADYLGRLQTTLDGLAAQRALEDGNYDALAAILNGNPNVGLSVDGEEFYGALGGLLASAMGGEFGNAFQRGGGARRPPPRRGGGSSRSARFPGLKDHTRRHQIGGRTFTYPQYLQSAARHTQQYHARYLMNYHMNGHNFSRYNYVNRTGPDSFLFTSTSSPSR